MLKSTNKNSQKNKQRISRDVKIQVKSLFSKKNKKTKLNKYSSI